MSAAAQISAHVQAATRAACLANERRFMVEPMLISFPVKIRPRQKTRRSIPAPSPHDLPPYPGIVITACFMNAASAIDSKLNRVGLPLQIDVAGAFFGRSTGLGRAIVVDSWSCH